MIKNGRQIGTKLQDIRLDHRKRYGYARTKAQEAKVTHIADVGSGTGYGAYMLAEAGFLVDSFEIDPEAVAYGNKHWSHPNLRRHIADLADLSGLKADFVTMFEIIEHTDKAPSFMANLKADFLVGSVPNEEVVQFETATHWQHYRHYTPEQFEEELIKASWLPVETGCQIGKTGPDAHIRTDTTNGRTLVYYANRCL